MAIVLTNGTNYITHNRTGAVIKTSDIEQAQDFHTVGRAIRQKEKTPVKCSGYYWVNTEHEGNKTVKPHVPGNKRKKFSAKDRLDIYRKTEGHCYLCGEFVDFDSFEVEHFIPVSKGGSNHLKNLFPACHCCNSIKHDIYPKEFMDKITQIFLYQMQKKYGDSLKWKAIRYALKRMA